MVLIDEYVCKACGGTSVSVAGDTIWCGDEDCGALIVDMNSGRRCDLDTRPEKTWAPKPKKVLSPEHLQAMIEGRRKARTNGATMVKRGKAKDSLESELIEFMGLVKEIKELDTKREELMTRARTAYPKFLDFIHSISWE